MAWAQSKSNLSLGEEVVCAQMSYACSCMRTPGAAHVGELGPPHWLGISGP